MYKVIYHRYGKVERSMWDYRTIESAKLFCEHMSNEGEGFPEYILDKDDIIVWDGKDGVVGIEHEDMIGKRYKEGKNEN